MSETYEKEKASRRPQGPMRRGHGRPVEKAKDFKGTLRKPFVFSISLWLNCDIAIY